MNGESLGEVQRAVLLLDAASATAAAVTRTLDDRRVEYVMVGRWTEVLERVVEQVVEIVLLDLAMTGAPGIRLIGMVQAVAPNVAIVVLSEFEVIDLAVLEAGASLVLKSSDLRRLDTVLRQGAVSSSDPSARSLSWTFGSRRTNAPS